MQKGRSEAASFMYSDEEEDGAGETDCSEGGHDKKLEALWSRKQRRRSSDLKIVQGDRLKLLDNYKMVILATKNSEGVGFGLIT